MYQRYLIGKINSLLEPNKVLVIYGPRRAGKTTLLNTFLSGYQGKYFLGFGEDEKLKGILASHEIERYKSFFAEYDLIVIDEAQKIPEIGLALKLLVDHLPGIKVIASGSSSFELANKIGEPLTGRQNIIKLYPLSLLELAPQLSKIGVEAKLEELLIYGTYPEAMTKASYKEKTNYLTQLRDSYLYKDILELENLKNSDKLSDLLRLLAFQLGNEVSLNELSNSLDLSKQTVARYLDLLEKAFVIIKVRGFSRNLRKEISKTCRYYFLDNGVRNAVINNFNEIKTRNDLGGLWENFLFMERLKKQAYARVYSNIYFWRTYDQKEVDLVEEREGNLFGFEFKWGSKKTKPPKLWLKTYPEAQYKVIDRNNYLDFVT